MSLSSGGGGDDAARALCFHLLQLIFETEEEATEVGVAYQVPILGRHLVEGEAEDGGPIRTEPSVVEGDIQSAKGVQSGLDHALGVILHRDVGQDIDALASQGLDLCHGVLGGLLTAPGHHCHIGAAGGKVQSSLPAHTRGAPGD